MKRAVYVFGVLILVLALVACVDKKNSISDEWQNEFTLEELIEGFCNSLGKDISVLGDVYEIETDENDNEIKRIYKLLEMEVSFEYVKEQNAFNICASNWGTCKCEFDEKCFLVAWTVFDSNGDKSSSWEFMYSDTGKVEKVIFYDEYENKTVMEYDENGKNFKTTEYDNQGSLTSWTEYDDNGIKTINNVREDGYDVQEYDAAGNRVKYTVYDNEDNIQYWYEYKYDEHGNESKRSKYGADGKLIVWHEYDYDYIDGRWYQTEETYYDAEGNVKEHYINSTWFYQLVDKGLNFLFSPLGEIEENWFLVLIYAMFHV